MTLGSRMDEAVIAGYGHTEYGKLPGRSTISMNLEAISIALEASNMDKDDVDALFVKYPSSGFSHMYAQSLAEAMGIRPSIGGVWDQAGASFASMIGFAAMAIAVGQIETAVVTYADNPRTTTRQAYQSPLGPYRAPGWVGAVAGYAMVARAHMGQYGTTSEQLGALARTCRENGARNPDAQLRKPISISDHQSSDWIVEPLRRDDCCLVSDGGAAVIVMSQAAAKRHGVTEPVSIRGYGQAQESWDVAQRPKLYETVAKRSATEAFAMADVRPQDIDVAQLYDCFTITLLMTLEEYGFAKAGQAGAMALDGAFDVGGELPINTSGGLLSETGMPGMQLVMEAVRQLRGSSANQVPGASTAIVSNQGGIMHTHSTLILGV